MYIVKRATQLNKFFRHNVYQDVAADFMFKWLEKVNANFKDEDDFRERMPRLIEKFLVSTTEDEHTRSVIAQAYFGIRDAKVKWGLLIDKNTPKKTTTEKKTIHIKNSEPAKDAEEPTEEKGEPKRRVSGTEKIYKNGNTEIYKTTIDNEPTLMILIKNYSTDDLIKSLVSEFVEDVFDLLSF